MKIPDYKISSIRLLLEDTLRIAKQAKQTPNNADDIDVIIDTLEDALDELEEIENEMGTDTSKECCLCMHFNGVSSLTTNCNCFINNISINYILE